MKKEFRYSTLAMTRFNFQLSIDWGKILKYEVSASSEKKSWCLAEAELEINSDSKSWEFPFQTQSLISAWRWLAGWLPWYRGWVLICFKFPIVCVLSADGTKRLLFFKSLCSGSGTGTFWRDWNFQFFSIF